MSILNQYSFAVFAVIAGLALAVGLWRWRQPAPILRIGLLAGYGVLVVLIGLATRYPDPEARSLAETDAVLAGGQPVFLMLYSNY